MVDALLGAGIQPFVTLYHWDLPQALQERGGWPARETVDAFCEYAALMARRLGDRVKDWTTLNEPFVSAVMGHFEGRHAPGHTDPTEMLATVHHLLLAHGRAVQILREFVPNARVGIVNVHQPIQPASASEPDRLAAERGDGMLNRTFLDPLVGRGYPEVVPYERSVLESFIREGDMERIAAPLDFLGVNYYTRRIERSAAVPEAENAPRTVLPSDETTGMGWEVYPEGLHEILERLDADYGFPAYYITENGAAYPDVVDEDGGVRDGERTSYLARHIGQVARLLDAGIPLRGYFVWSLLDNFEWSYGFSKRLGLVYVDFETGARTPKDSYSWYRGLIERRTLRLDA